MTAIEELARAARMAVDAMEHTEYFSDRTDPDKPHLVVDRLSTALARFDREAPVREAEAEFVEAWAALNTFKAGTAQAWNAVETRYHEAKKALLAARGGTSVNGVLVPESGSQKAKGEQT